MDLMQVIKRPLVTEKSTRLGLRGEYTFAVDVRAKKPEIAAAVSKLFGVKVVRVRTAIMPGKVRRSGRKRLLTKGKLWKKAIIKVAEGEKIELLEVS